MTRPDLHLTRRDMLRTAAAGAGAGALGLNAFAANPLTPLRAGLQTKHIVLIVMAGGVRSRETFGSPGNVPNLVSLADEGVLYTRLHTANLGHFGASMSIVTGISEARGIRDNSRAPDPTIFEYVRKDLGLPASEVWVTTSGGAQQVNYAYGLHPDYGQRFGATTLDGDGIFNEEFKGLVARMGTPRPLSDRDSSRVEDLRRVLRGGRPADASEASRARVERYILDELGRGVTEMSGAGAGDAKALRLARNLLSVFRPRLIGVVLQQADIAHGSFNGYSEVIRRNDAAIGELVNAIKGDEGLRDSTSVFVLPEFGRDSDLNTRRGLDHGDGSDDLRFVHGVAWGPDFKRGKVVTDDRRTIDVMPTVAHMFGADARYSKGSVLKESFA
ncbi:MAG: twin-arginine translocation signal domain-containing protein [Planctomycetota bacterium]